jgi:glycosyltransferase involved in cell wall biosynthesis
MRVVAVTNLFPNATDPLFCPFNRQQFAALSRLCDVDVVAPIPWFPGAGVVERRSRAGRLRAAPRRDRIDGLDVSHPRYLHVPRVGQWISGMSFAAGLVPQIPRLRGRVDVVLGAWAYPDGVASLALARALGVPAVIKLHGSDINVVGKLPGPRMWLRAGLPRASRVVAVSRRLGEEAVSLGVDPERVELVFNGVDLDLFRVRDRSASRAEVGFQGTGKLVLFVGTVQEEKGVGDLLEAFDAVWRAHPDATLALIGDGPMRARCEEKAAASNGRLLVLGRRPHTEVARWIGACDVLTLPSWNEGTPNVVLEALASGRRVVASDVGGIPDLLSSPGLGRLVPRKRADRLGDALGDVLSQDYDPEEVAADGSRGDWDASARHLLEVLRRARAEAR